jgi:adenosylcobinamide kinase/adenosylcobinamide-phosphate guanylyltransferase
VIVLIGGGSRSGKSRHALEYARRFPAPRTFLATAEALDAEMRERISAHQAERGAEFATVEAPLDLAGALPLDGVCVIDCLTLWTSNLLFAERDIPAETERLLAAARRCPATLIFVTNEVGCGIVPENELARRFRDAAGRLNQQVAAVADEVWWMAFGCPLKVK